MKITSNSLRKTIFIVFCLIIAGRLIATDVKEFGAVGDGDQDDTEAIYKALENMEDGELFFSRGNYLITRSIEIDLQQYGPLRIRGIGSGSTILMSGNGPAFIIKGTHKDSADPNTVSEKVWAKEKFFAIESLEIVGKNENSDGIELRYLMQPVVWNCLIRSVRHGIRLTDRNRNVLIEGNQIYEGSGVGIYLKALNLHQINIVNNHISYFDRGGIRVENSEIRNFQIVGNDIEYNYASKDHSEAGDVVIDLSAGGSVREGTITGNTIQALESTKGANVRFRGSSENNRQVGLWSISGNHISSQTYNVALENCQGISINGNSFIRGFDRNVWVENCKNIVLTGNVFDDNEDYLKKDGSAEGGITILNSENIVLSDNIIQISGSGEGEKKVSAITIGESRKVILSGNLINSSGHYGIEITDSKRISLKDNSIQNENGKSDFRGSIILRGDCSQTILFGNQLSAGENGVIINEARGVKISKNQVLK